MNVYQESDQRAEPSLKSYLIFLLVCLLNASCIFLILGGL